MSTVSTHGLIMTVGKFAGQRYTRIPVGYLRWMVNAGHKEAALARAELNRRGVSLQDRDVEISNHAIDTASLRLLRRWREERDPGQGLYSWLADRFMAALEKGVNLDDETVEHLGVRFVYESGCLYPVLKTVMPSNNQRNDGE